MGPMQMHSTMSCKLLPFVCPIEGGHTQSVRRSTPADALGPSSFCCAPFLFWGYVTVNGHTETKGWGWGSKGWGSTHCGGSGTHLTALNAYKISKSSKSRKIRVSCTFAAFMSPSTSLMDESNAFYASFGCLPNVSFYVVRRCCKRSSLMTT